MRTPSKALCETHHEFTTAVKVDSVATLCAVVDIKSSRHLGSACYMQALPCDLRISKTRQWRAPSKALCETHHEFTTAVKVDSVATLCAVVDIKSSYAI